MTIFVPSLNIGVRRRTLTVKPQLDLPAIQKSLSVQWRATILPYNARLHCPGYNYFTYYSHLGLDVVQKQISSQVTWEIHCLHFPV